jgi:hypothetical protein
VASDNTVRDVLDARFLTPEKEGLSGVSTQVAIFSFRIVQSFRLC